MKVLVLGNDGRAHALVWKLFNSIQASQVLCCPGNGGTGQLAPQVDLNTSNVVDIAHWAFEQNVDIIVPTSSQLLNTGIFDEAASFNIPVCGPSKQFAWIATSRCAAKEFLLRHTIPTAPGRVFTDVATAEKYLAAQPLPVVIKADHRAVRSGIYQERYAALQALREFFDARPVEGTNDGVVIETFLPGAALSISALTDGQTTLAFLPARIYDRLYEDDHGPRAPGIGAHTGHSTYSQKLTLYLQNNLLTPIVTALTKEQVSYRGLIGIDCVVTDKGPRVTGLRSAMHDQEAQVVLPRLEDDLMPLLQATTSGRLHQYTTLHWKDMASVGIALVAEGYPHHFPMGSSVDGLTDVDEGILIFHDQTHNPSAMQYDVTQNRGPDPLAELIMGVGRRTSAITTTGGHVLTVVALAATLNGARGRAVLNAERINFAGRYYRGDIGKREFR